LSREDDDAWVGGLMADDESRIANEGLWESLSYRLLP
jgi:hypothetical protein